MIGLDDMMIDIERVIEQVLENETEGEDALCSDGVPEAAMEAMVGKIRALVKLKIDALEQTITMREGQVDSCEDRIEEVEGENNSLIADIAELEEDRERQALIAMFNSNGGYAPTYAIIER